MILLWGKFMRKAIEMMEIRLAGRMRQCPIRPAAARVLGDRYDATRVGMPSQRVGHGVILSVSP
jgi:hypothetical protein